ncbi:hypothetical protein BLA29_014117 [Euroglyphus maynei]|uniref:Uncharacterized protein n=1 Tax=Euroglyphus maynei TaxID=6958 RepID=A0A1Y3B155_EURMA|nr:hypothetical protein BLA29_014117 [Euroglyphus maynei]
MIQQMVRTRRPCIQDNSLFPFDDVSVMNSLRQFRTGEKHAMKSFRPMNNVIRLNTFLAMHTIM